MPMETAAMHKSSRNALVTSMTVCIGFVLCWSSNEIAYFLRFIGFGYVVNRSQWFRSASVLLVYFNSCINPSQKETNSDCLFCIVS